MTPKRYRKKPVGVVQEKRATSQSRVPEGVLDRVWLAETRDKTRNELEAFAEDFERHVVAVLSQHTTSEGGGK